MLKKLLPFAMCAYIGTKSVLATTMTRGELVPWLASQTDVLAEDWLILE